MIYLLIALCVALVRGQTHTLSDLRNISCTLNTCNLLAFVDSASSGATVPLRLTLFSSTIIQYWLAIDGNFSDVGAAADVIVAKPSSPLSVVLSDKGSFYEITQAPASSPNVVVHLQKSPLLLTIMVNGQAVVTEATPLTYNSTSSWQTLTRDVIPSGSLTAKEYFFGAGMQNGHWSHRDQVVQIGVDYNWAENGHPNSAPFYVSSSGVGVMRNTWASGSYSFSSPVVTTHLESTRFDAFYMLAAAGPRAIKDVLGLYTMLTGPPFLPPLYGMFLGDSDCYHNSRHGNSSQVAITIARQYEDHDMPRGWMLINDGYGCGYGEGPAVFPSNLTDLTYIVAEMHKLGIYTGLWTSTGMPNIQGEVGVAGTRICKTDVGWIGAGYKYAFDGVTLCAGGIEDYSSPPARRFVWTVEGWAGTHRLAVMWAGDDSGSMDYIRWQIPTFVGCGFSAQAHVSGDIDGIFGGSPESYVRDLQFKSLTTTIMTMSGWAENPEKQPWAFGEPYTTINRASLKLKSQLTPYLYSYSRQAYDTGVPPIRAMLLEFPGDESLYTPNNSTSYQFLSGEYILVAPVFEGGAVTRDGIYLPNGTQWVDYWDGTLYEGNQTLDNYSAPLYILPMFVKAGAIIPMWPPLNYFNEAPWDPMFLELWPSGNTTFTLYEDDGVTRDALPPTNRFATTPIAVVAPTTYLSGGTSASNVTISVAAAQGSFTGQLTQRGWWMNVRCKSPPLEVVLTVTGGGGGAAPMVIPEMGSEPELESVPFGWFHDTSLQPNIGGLLMIKLSTMATSQGFTLTLSNGPSYPRIGTEDCDTPAHHQVENQKFQLDEGSGLITVASDATQCLTIGKAKDNESHTPALEVQPCAAALAAAQQFVVLPASKQIALKSDTTACLDQDVSDSRVIEYGCHSASSPGNQAWNIDPVTQHIVSLANGLCMCVLPASA